MKKLDITIEGNPIKSKVMVDGEDLPVTRLQVDVDASTLRTSVEMSYMQGQEPITVKGILVEEGDLEIKALQRIADLIIEFFEKPPGELRLRILDRIEAAKRELEEVKGRRRTT